MSIATELHILGFGPVPFFTVIFCQVQILETS